MRRMARVFVDQETYCPGYQFRRDLSPNPVMVGLFERALELRIPHNYLALWMMTHCPALHGSRPVDRLKPSNRAALHTALESTLARAVA